LALSLRARLTSWHAAVLLGALVVFGAWVYVVETRLRLAELDADLRRAAVALAAGVDAEMEEGTSLTEAAPEACREFSAPGRVLWIDDGAGRLFAGRALPGIGAGSTPAEREGAATVVSGGESWRVVAVSHRAQRASYRVAAAAPLAALVAEGAILRRALFVGIPLAVALAAAGGWWVALRALAPVTRMADQARLITHRSASFRLEAPASGDEVGSLAEAFNDLLARLDAALRAQRRFMADASHELRTPLSIVRSAADVTLSRETRAEAEYRDALGVVAEHARRLGRMVDDMLTLARADAGGLKLEARPLYLDEIVEGCARDARVLAGERGIEVLCPPSTEAPFDGDERLLRQMLMNLLDNAVRHTRAGGRVAVRLVAEAARFEISVRDEGPGIPPGEEERIFERFVRTEAGRGRPGGAGLGLPIARCIAEAHGGTVHLATSGPGGSTFLARLPRDAPGPATEPSSAVVTERS
jgi:heavy metal sensor kinase